MAGLSYFTNLSPGTYLYDPFVQKLNEESLTANPQHPDTIILCTWPSAKPHEISRYTSGYAALFPTSRILLLKSGPESHLESCKNSHTQPSPLHAAATALLPTSYPLPISRNLSFNPARRRTFISTSRRGVLLHVFSTPGALQACELARAYRTAFAGRALDVQAVIFDAIPLIAHDWSRDANILLEDGLAAGVRSVLDGVWSWVRGGGIEHGDQLHGEAATTAAQSLARDLNDRTLLRQGARHCYVYPERNTIESWKASASGKVERMDWFVLRDQVDVDKEQGKMGVDERRYWAAIEELWD